MARAARTVTGAGRYLLLGGPAEGQRGAVPDPPPPTIDVGRPAPGDWWNPALAELFPELPRSVTYRLCATGDACAVYAVDGEVVDQVAADSIANDAGLWPSGGDTIEQA